MGSTTPVRTRRLIVHADDYGLTPGVSAGILRAHRLGIVTSTSVLAVGPAFEATAAWLVDTPSLDVGVHLAAVGEDPPLLSAREIPTLVDGGGHLAASWRVMVSRMIAGRVDGRDLESEFAAQIERVRQAGLTPTHVDTHQHLHLWPVVREAALRAALAAGIRGVRVPFCSGKPYALAYNTLARHLRRRAAEMGMVHPQRFAGGDASGHLDATALTKAVARLSAGDADSCELMTHPGTADDPARARYAWGFEWATELALLTAPATRELVAAHGFVLSGYADLDR